MVVFLWFTFPFFGACIFLVVYSSWVVAVFFACEVSNFLVVVTIHGFDRTYVLWCPVLFSAESAVVAHQMCRLVEIFGFWFRLGVFLVWTCLYALDRFLSDFFVLSKCWGNGRFHLSSVVTILGNQFLICFNVWCFLANSFPRCVFPIMNFDISRSFCFFSLKSLMLLLFFCNVTIFSHVVLAFLSAHGSSKRIRL